MISAAPLAISCTSYRGTKSDDVLYYVIDILLVQVKGNGTFYVYKYVNEP